MSKEKTKKTRVEKSEMVKGFYFTLSEEELDDIADEVVDLLTRRGKMELEFAEVKRDWSTKIKTFSSEIEGKRQTHDSRKEWRTVRCVQVKDYDKKQIRWEMGGKTLQMEPMRMPAQMPLEVSDEPDREDKPEQDGA